MNDSVYLRPCLPSDAKEAVPLIYASGPKSFDYVFQSSTQSAHDFLQHAFVRRGGEFSFDNHYALMKGDELLGVGAVFSNKKAHSFTFYDALNIIRFYKFRFFKHAWNGLQVESIICLPKKNEIALAHLGIKENLRGQGYGTLLIQELMKIANPSSQSIFILDVSEENPKAKALYENLGFIVEKKNLSHLVNQYAKVANHFRMYLKAYII